MPRPEQRSSLAAPELVDRLVFPAPASTYHAGSWPGELIWLNPYGDVPECGEADGGLEEESNSGDDRVPALLLLAPVSKVFVLCLHGNGDDLGRFYSFCHRLRVCCSVHVLAVEYPGYGICSGGQATDASVNRNAFVGFRFLTDALHWPVDDIIVFGRSVGCGPALEIASRHPVAGVTLVSPFMSVSELARHFVGRLADFVPERYNNVDLIKQTRSPVMIVHGKKDTLVPVEHGKALFEVCKARKFLVTPDLMGHNTNLHRDTSFFVIPFLSFFSVLPPIHREVNVPWSVYDRPKSPQFVCGTFFGSQCCLPRSGLGAMPSKPLHACRLNSAMETQARRRGGADEETQERSMPSKAVPPRSSLTEPAYDTVCKPRLLVREPGAAAASPRRGAEEEDLRAEMIEVESDCEMWPSPVDPPFGRGGLAASQGTLDPAFPVLPGEWVPPIHLEVPAREELVASDQGDTSEELLSVGIGEGLICKPGALHPQSSAMSRSGEETREPSEEARESGAAQSVDQDVGVGENFVTRFV